MNKNIYNFRIKPDSGPMGGDVNMFGFEGKTDGMAGAKFDTDFL
jgi:hypothetical protein